MAAQKSGLDEMFDLLSHPYRRYVLYHLTRESDTVNFDTLAGSLADWDADRSKRSPETSSAPIELQLQHTHLPKLADSGLITIDQEGQSIELVGTNGHDEFLDQAARIDGYGPPVASD